MGATRGELARLEAFTAAMLPRVGQVAGPLVAYRAALAQATGAASDLPVTLPDRSGTVETTVDRLRTLDRQPQLFAIALRHADRFPFLGGTDTLTDRWIAALDAALAQAPTTAAEREARGRELADELIALTSGDGDVATAYHELAALLGELDAQDPFLLAGFHERMSPRQFFVLLERVYDAHWLDGARYTPAHAVSDEDPDLVPMRELLEPLTAAFESAAAMELLPSGFTADLFAIGQAQVDAHEPGFAPLLQLLVFGDVLNTGNAEVTVTFSRLVFDDLFFEHTRFLWGGMSPYLARSPDGGVIQFDVETQVAAAAQALADHPEAAYEFLLDRDNQALLLNRAGESWWWDADGTRPLPSEVIESGLLAHPLELGFLDSAFPAPYVSALRDLVTEVSGRNRVGASVARGLGLVLAPHYDSFRFAVDHNADQPDVLQLEAATLRAYLAKVSAHDPGIGALQHVWAGWSAEVYAGWAPRLVEAGPLVEQFDTRFYYDTGGLFEVHRLLDAGLRDAGLDHEQRHRVTFWALDKASGLARSRIIKATRLTGPKGFVAGEALSWAGSHGTDWVKDQVRGAGPADADEAREMLRHDLPVLAVKTMLLEFDHVLAQIDDPVERERLRDEYVPVEPGVRDYTYTRDKDFGERSVWEKFTVLWSSPTVEETVEVDFLEWPEEVLQQWLLENMAVYDRDGVDASLWWLNLPVSDAWKGIEVRTR